MVGPAWDLLREVVEATEFLAGLRIVQQNVIVDVDIGSARASNHVAAVRRALHAMLRTISSSSTTRTVASLLRREVPGRVPAGLAVAGFSTDTGR